MGSSRGFFVGQLVDDLNLISTQVKARNAVGLMDLTKLLEDFFKDVMNDLYGYSLENLNKSRSNEPGLDLGDKAKRVAFQVTSTPNLAKVHKTLKAITKDQKADYDTFNILVIGKKQSSYALDTSLAESLKFTDKNNIWDVTDLCRQALSLDIVKLQDLQAKVAREMARVRIELEPRLADGSHETSVDDFIEPKAEVIRSDATVFAAHDSASDLYGDPTAAQKLLDAWIDALMDLPRITREFYGVLLDRAITTADGTRLQVNDDWLRRIIRMPDLDGELRLLRDGGFLSFDEPEEFNQSPKWRVLLPSAGRYFHDPLVSFIVETGLNAKSLVMSMDFSPFGPPPA